MKNIIKQYCKTHKLKFEKYTRYGFIASCLIPIRAGMEKDIHTGKNISFEIKTIGKKRVYSKFICFSDGDIVDNGITYLGANGEEISKKEYCNHKKQVS